MNFDPNNEIWPKNEIWPVYLMGKDRNKKNILPKFAFFSMKFVYPKTYYFVATMTEKWFCFTSKDFEILKK